MVTDPTKSKVLQTLHVMIHERLFGGGRWRASSATIEALSEKLRPFALTEPVPGSPDGWRATALGGEINVDLMMVFLGMWDEWEVPEILHENGLISSAEMRRAQKYLSEKMDWHEDTEPVLLPLVRRAFLVYCGASAGAN